MANRQNVETFEFPRVSIGFFLQALEAEMRKDMERKRIPKPMLAIGLAGIGKTEGIKSIANKLGIGMLEMRLVNYSETDLIGIPFLNEDQRTEHATNVLFPNEQRDGKYGILLIDEFTSAARNIQVPILQLTDSSRSVGQYKLPDGWKIVIAGNGPNDGGTFTNLPGTVISRAGCFYVEPSVESWLDWAGKNRIHHAIRAFIRMNGDKYLHDYTEDEATGYDRAFASPRSWANLSEVLYDFDEAHTGWTARRETYEALTDHHKILVASRIGNSTADRFESFVAFETQLIDPMKILGANDDASRAKLPKLSSMAPELQYLTITSLSDNLARVANGKPVAVVGTEVTIKPAYIQALANAINWIYSGVTNPTGEMATFATAELTSDITGFAHKVFSSEMFRNLCPLHEHALRNLGENIFRN